MNSEDYPYWLTFARNISKHSNYRTQVGCVLVKGNHPISVGFNRAKYNKVYGNPWRKSIHAESNAIMTSGKDKVKKCTAYIYRETKDGKSGMARPCGDCMARLKLFGAKKVIYSISEYPYYMMEII